MQLADQRHVAERLGIPRVVDAVAVLELDDEARRVAQVERRLAAGVPVAGRVVGAVTIVTRRPAASTVPPLFMPIDGVGAARQPARQPQAHLVHARPGRPQPARQGDGVAHVVEVPVGHEQQVAAIDGVGRHRARRVAEPRVDDARSCRPAVSIRTQEWPYQVIVVPSGSPMALPPSCRRVDASRRGYTRGVPATQIAQNLAFINWTVLTGLALGAYAAVVLLRRRTAATRGYLGFVAACAIGFGVLAWLSDRALPGVPRHARPVVLDPAWDAPRRVALRVLLRDRV